MPKPTSSRSTFCHVVLLILSTSHAAAQPTFQGIGDLPGGTFESTAAAISADGTTVVGRSTTATGPEAFRWSSGVLSGLGFLDGGVLAYSEAMDVSADGSVIVGRSGTASFDFAPFRWDGTMINLLAGTGLGPHGGALGVSPDGSEIVGHVGSVAGDIPATPFPNPEFWGFQAFRWTGSTSLLTPVPASGSSATVQARAGNGYAGTLDGDSYTWQAGSYFFGPVSPNYVPADISDSGAVTVGKLNNQPALERPPLFQNAAVIGALPGAGPGAAYAMSLEGSIVVGTSAGKAFIYDEVNGMREVATLLTGLGIDLTGWSLTEATGVSSDGKTLVGNGTSPNGTEAWIARIPTADGVLTDARRVSGDTSGGDGCGVTTLSRMAPPATPHFVASELYDAGAPDQMSAAQDSHVDAGHFYGTGSTDSDGSGHFCARSIYEIRFEVVEAKPYQLAATLIGWSSETRLILEGEVSGVVHLFNSDPAGTNVNETGELAPDVYRLFLRAVSGYPGSGWTFDLELDPTAEPPTAVPGLTSVALGIAAVALAAGPGIVGVMRRRRLRV